MVIFDIYLHLLTTGNVEVPTDFNPGGKDFQAGGRAHVLTLLHSVEVIGRRLISISLLVVDAPPVYR